MRDVVLGRAGGRWHHAVHELVHHHAVQPVRADLGALDVDTRQRTLNPPREARRHALVEPTAAEQSVHQHHRPIAAGVLDGRGAARRASQRGLVGRSRGRSCWRPRRRPRLLRAARRDTGCGRRRLRWLLLLPLLHDLRVRRRLPLLLLLLLLHHLKAVRWVQRRRRAQLRPRRRRRREQRAANLREARGGRLQRRRRAGGP